MHSRWENCPKAWQGAFSSGKNSTGPTVVLEALCDYHLWFWHASFGYAGSLNDLNILNLSPFLNTLLDGSFSKLEEQSQVVPFTIADEEFSSMFVLVDGIYPTYSRFVQGLSQPHEPNQVNYTAWQEGARKDIERAFGVLQGRFQIMVRPFHAHCLKKIGKMVRCALIMHNMCVSDRVMNGNVDATYDPSDSVDMDDYTPPSSNDIETIILDERNSIPVVPLIGLDNAPQVVRTNMIEWQKHWKELDNKHEHFRLRNAIMHEKWDQRNNYSVALDSQGEEQSPRLF
jgi:hypothetical protein